MLLHSITCVISSMAIGYALYTIIYWKKEHAIVKFRFGVLTDSELMLILAVVGLFLSFI